MISRNHVFAALLAFSVADSGSATARDAKEPENKPKHDESAPGHSHEMSEIHGGRVTMTPNHHFEVLFTSTEARVYAYDKRQKPLRIGEDAKVSVVLSRKSGGDVELPLQYVAPDAKKGHAQGYFAATHDFSSVEEGSMKALVRVQGLGDEAIEFKTNVTVSEPASYVCPMKCGSAAADPMACPTCGMKMVRQNPQESAGGTEHDHSAHQHSSHDRNH